MKQIQQRNYSDNQLVIALFIVGVESLVYTIEIA